MKLITGLLLLESFILSLVGGVVGILLHRVLIGFVGPVLQSEFGMNFQLGFISQEELIFMLVLISVCLIISLIPAGLAHKQTLKDGLIPRI